MHTYICIEGQTPHAQIEFTRGGIGTMDPTILEDAPRNLLLGGESQKV